MPEAQYADKISRRDVARQNEPQNHRVLALRVTGDASEARWLGHGYAPILAISLLAGAARLLPLIPGTMATRARFSAKITHRRTRFPLR